MRKVPAPKPRSKLIGIEKLWEMEYRLDVER